MPIDYLFLSQRKYKSGDADSLNSIYGIFPIIQYHPNIKKDEGIYVYKRGQKKVENNVYVYNILTSLQKYEFA
jgi:hypothetical protein